MKKYLIFLFILLSSYNLNAQLFTVGIQGMKSFVKNNIDLMDPETYQLIQRLYRVIDATYCQAQHFEYLSSLAADEDCITNLKIEMTLVNIEYSNHLIKLITSVTGASAFLHESESIKERLKNAIEAMEKAQANIASFNRTIEYNLLDEAHKTFIKQRTSPKARSFSANRYN